jgi:signal transduction histidine kinase
VILLALLLFLTGCLGVSWAVVVYRADPRRWDNRVFAAIGAIDAAMAFLRAFAVYGGTSLIEVGLGRWCAVLSIALSWLTIELAYSFPRSKPAPTWLRLLVLLCCTVSCGFLVAPGWRSYMLAISFVFFLPMFALTVALLWRTYRQTGLRSAPVRLVLIAVVMRWLTAMTAYSIARPIDARAFEVALTFDATFSVLASFVLIGFAVLSGNLFRVRGIVAEVTAHAALFIATAAATYGAIEGILRSVADPTLARLLLFAAALLPLALVYGGRGLRARLERAVLAPLDPRRAVRTSVLERVVVKGSRGDAQEAAATVSCALADVTEGGAVRLLAAPGRRLPGSVGELPAAEAAALEGGDHLHGERRLLVPLRAGGVLYGALEVEGGQIDRDSLLAAAALANHLAVKLENQSLFAELEESRRLATLGAFAAAIAHDIRTPLASVQMNVQILRGKLQLSDDDMEHFDIALEELARLNASIGELLDYAKPVRLAPAPLELREVADDAARGIAPVLSERRVALELDIADGLPPVRADAQRLRQVLLNLLDNAAKASAPGAAVVLRGASADGGRVAIEVADQGKGIAASDLPRIFEPFYTTRPDGTGLGLAIVQKLVRAHAGDVVVRSSPGQGSSFTVLLPAG